MDLTQSVTFDDIKAAKDAFYSDSAHIIAKNAVTNNGLRNSSRNPEGAAKNTTVFDIDLNQGERCDQQRSGRCWMFASYNTFRYHIIKNYNLKTFELSETYPLFYDKLEKSNWFLTQILDTLDEETNSRLISFLLTDPVGDGGQWDMFKALTKKYGVVPKEAMPETACSKNTAELDRYLTRYLRACAMTLRNKHSENASLDELLELKKDMMQNVYSLLTTCLGTPPETFEVRLRDKDDKLVVDGTYTPQEFFDETVRINLDDYVSLISANTSDKPFNKTYTVSRLGNVVEQGQVLYLNLDIEELKACAVKQLKDDIPVWFGSDVSQSYISSEGIMDTASLDVDLTLGFEVEKSLNRAERLEYGESLMTHAMVFEGVNFNEDDYPVLWKVENSWGKDHGKNGFDSISDSWFNEYVYQVVVDKKYLTQSQRDLLEKLTPIKLAPWDPMGSLA